MPANSADDDGVHAIPGQQSSIPIRTMLHYCGSPGPKCPDSSRSCGCVQLPQGRWSSLPQCRLLSCLLSSQPLRRYHQLHHHPLDRLPHDSSSLEGSNGERGGNQIVRMVFALVFYDFE